MNNIEEVEGIVNSRDVYLCGLCMNEDLINDTCSLRYSVSCKVKCKMCWVDYIDGLRVKYCMMGRYDSIC